MYRQSKKNLLSSNISSTHHHNMVNFGPLAAEIISLVWGTPGNFNGFRVLAALLHSQTAALNRGRHLYSAGRPSRWALAHISSSMTLSQCFYAFQFILISICQMMPYFYSSDKLYLCGQASCASTDQIHIMRL